MSSARAIDRIVRTRPPGNRTVEFLLSLGALGLGLALVVGFVLLRTYAPAAAGVGDPYFPAAGGSGYDAISYGVEVTYEPDTGRIDGHTWVTVKATQPLDVVHLDLLLPASRVTVGGAEVSFTQNGSDLAIQLPTLVGIPGTRTDELVHLDVFYGGRLADARFDGDSPLYDRDGELLICGEPESASLWFPVNDHPSDPATYDIQVSVPSGLQALSVGKLVSHGADPGRPGHDLWHWSTDVDAPSYTTMLAVGHYAVEQTEVSVGGVSKQAVYAVSSRTADPAAAFAWLRKSAEVATGLERYLGSYPTTSIGGVVPGIEVSWGGMETLGRPVYHPRLVGDAGVMAHELAHMWLGNKVTLARWADLFDNESLASYLEWVSVSDAGGLGLQERFDAMYDKSPDSFWQQKLSDPGRTRLFTRVYDRGAMAVHALRVRMGDEAFLALLRAWTAQAGPRSLADFRQLAATTSRVEVRPLLSAWLDGTTRVTRSEENGFR